MSYKSAWIEKEEVKQIAKKFGLAAGDLLDRGADGEVFDGAYVGNIANKLRMHPLVIKAVIEDYLSRFKQRSRVETTLTIDDYKRRVWECGCGWSGPGTGNKGGLIDGDRCPDCGVYL